ncbi:P-type conjugative transfer protein TrbJ [Sphingobium scionense]|uniref:P-type conjugative transfer protein TrbJ n=1 Tax=Sphingobium scionense TaxID=1404341 RepID=A0A7W6LUK1_9SPHN|nr:P-type conjugative transfer protein TrbJ [Sphingobium scionense]MBB4150437.1 P-type conjugative transfer protein TrbJ [Sphingobium scionense]
MRIPTRKYLVATALGAGTIGSLGALIVPIAPAHAQLTVFDPSNYSQNLLTAARTLQQVNNQIRSLQNQAQSLVNQAKNLTTIGFPEIQAITQTLQQIDQLMGQAQGIQFRVAGLDQEFRALFPQSFNQAMTMNGQVVAARTRLDTEMAAYRQTMGVQAQVVENVQADAQTLNGIVSRSQGAEGALQAQQATNQLLALTAKQQFQIQNLMAAQYRAQAVEQARRAQAEIDARAMTTKFLGSGSAYTPQ